MKPQDLALIATAASLGAALVAFALYESGAHVSSGLIGDIVGCWLVAACTFFMDRARSVFDPTPLEDLVP